MSTEAVEVLLVKHFAGRERFDYVVDGRSGWFHDGTFSCGTKWTNFTPRTNSSITRLNWDLHDTNGALRDGLTYSFKYMGKWTHFHIQMVFGVYVFWWKKEGGKVWAILDWI